MGSSSCPAYTCVVVLVSPHPRSTLTKDARSFIGRETDLEALASRLRAGRALVTIAGPPGVGKTFLARELGRRMLDSEAGLEVRFCDLSGARDADDVRHIILATLGAQTSGDAELALARMLSQRDQLLLIL